MDFISLNLCQPLLDALDEIGYVSPTPIQAQAIPDLIEGRDILGCAQTGTGKNRSIRLANPRCDGQRSVDRLTPHPRSNDVPDTRACIPDS